MPTRTLPVSPLGVLGFSAQDEAAYRQLLRRSPLAVRLVPGLLNRSDEACEELLSRLAGVGLIDLRQDTVFVPPPEQSIERLVNDETRRLDGVHEQLLALRGLIPALSAEHRKFRDTEDEQLSVRTIPVSRVVPTLQRLSAEHGGDLLWLRPDQWRLPEGESADSWVEEMLREGRKSRVIYPARAIEEAPETVRRRAQLGEHVRILADIPGRLGIIGSSVALVPHHLDVVDDTVMVIEQPSLVTCLAMLFESLWERALVVPGIDAQQGAAKESARTLLLDQLGRGTKDEQVARTLGQSLRTVRRRVADLMDELDASSRFQAGVEAVRRGWL